MKTNLKKAICLLCTMIVMFTVLAVPVSASETTEDTHEEITLPYTSPDGFIFDNLENASYGVPTPEQVREYSGNYKYISYMVFRGNNDYGGISTFVNVMCVNDLSNKTVNFNCNRSGSSVGVGVSCSSSDYSSFANHRFSVTFNNTDFNNDYFGSDSSSNSPSIGGTKNNVQSNIYIYSEIPFTINGNKATTDTKPPVPFTVTYSQELTTDMESNIVYIPSKGGANGDENGNLKEEINGFSVTVSLTDEYKNVMSENNLGTDYSQSSYSVIGCLSTEPITESTNMNTFFNEKVVLYSYGANTYQHSGLPVYDYANDNYTDDYTGRASTIDYGITPIFTISRDKPLSLGFPISAIDFDGLDLSRDTPLYVNIVGINALHYTNNTSEITYCCASTDDFLNLVNPFEIRTLPAIVKAETVDSSSSDDRGFTSHTNPHGSSGTVRENEKDVKYYYSYCVSSNSFKYSKYPDYQPITLTDSDGKQYNPSTSSLKEMLSIKPIKRTDNEDISSSNKGSKVEDTMKTPEDYETNLHNKTLSKNYGTFDFDTASLDQIFKETGSFFDFLTSCLSILPTYFITILISFFTVMLAIVLVKFVV